MAPHSADPQRYESIVDRQIREATERGDFDNLPGAGKPLPDAWYADRGEDWWIRRKLDQENVDRSVLLPPTVRLRRERDEILSTLADVSSEGRAREIVEDLNRRIVEANAAHVARGPVILVKKLAADEVIAAWRRQRP